jgi:hypothetical protein
MKGVLIGSSFIRVLQGTNSLAHHALQQDIKVYIILRPSKTPPSKRLCAANQKKNMSETPATIHLPTIT